MEFIAIFDDDRALFIEVSLFDYLVGLGLEALQFAGLNSRKPFRPTWNVNWWWRVLIAATELILLDLVEERLKHSRRHPTDKKSLLLRQHHASKPDNRSDSTVTAY